VRSQLFLNIFNSILFGDCCLLSNILRITRSLLSLCLRKQALHHGERVDQRLIWRPRPACYVIVDLVADLDKTREVFSKRITLFFILVTFIIFSWVFLRSLRLSFRASRRRFFSILRFILLPNLF